MVIVLLALAASALLAPTPLIAPRRAPRAPTAARPDGRQRGLVAGSGLAVAGLLVASQWWPLVIVLAVGGGVAVGRQNARVRPDKARCLGTLAVRLDLVAACLRSGLPVGFALTAVEEVLPVDAAADPDEPSAALHRVAALLALGAEPSAAWRPALACVDLVPVATAACRSAVGGTTVVGALTEQSAVLRARLTTLGAQRAGRAGVLIAAPLGVCFLPSFLCLGLAPVVIGLLGDLQMP
jgi:Flp pilus assembly protein TadB